jgi:hypothetical protein
VRGSTSTTSEPAAISGVDCVPKVEGPIATGASQPFRAALQSDLPSGWVDDEFFISCSSAAITYKTAVFVRRPEDVDEASGVVAVEPLHSLGIWGLQTLLQPYFVAKGDVHVGIAASNDVVERLLKPANPDRYASLDVPGTPDAENQILAGMGALLHRHPDALLPGVEFRTAILGGWSQTAVATRSFITSPEGRGAVRGKALYDGYYPGQAAVGSSGGHQVQRLPDDLSAPVIEVQGERELLLTIHVYGSLGYRRPDSDTYRLYEVPGLSHVNFEADNPVSSFANSLTCDWPAGATPSAFSQTQVWAMAFDNLVGWVRDGRTPPRAARIELEADGRTVSRDADGNALGGLRPVFVDVPTATIMPTSLAPNGMLENPCAYVGYQLNFDQTKLQELYGTHDGYVEQVTTSADALVRKGFLLPEGARELESEARSSGVLR